MFDCFHYFLPMTAWHRYLYSIFVTLIMSTAYADINGKVVAVTDGDTIKVLDENRQLHKVRLSGIDAPEKSQPFGNASRKHLISLVAGKDVRVETSKNDRYGRVLGKVWVKPRDCPGCGKTLNANHAQILSGMAWWYQDYAKDQTLEDQGRYASAVKDARERKVGLWREPNPVPPWVWRRGQRTSSTSRAVADTQCGTKQYCREMTSCDEAKFYLRQCGRSSMDGDKDGVPCESICQ
jgi:endonuclease YncB( thermonuclease family)